jgi:CspA family cold shock protein
MLEAIRRFLVRGRASRREQHQPVEEVVPIQPLDDSDAPPPSTEPQNEEPIDPPVPGKVKWFNPDKRYGFVALADGSGDAFLHASALQRLGIDAVQPGETLELRIAQGQRGLQVTEVLGVDSSTRVSSESPLPGFDSSAGEPTVEETGTVKWYSAAKRFGFIMRDDGGKDIFVHASVLQRAGIESLIAGQRVTVDIVEGRKGPEASSIRLA